MNAGERDSVWKEGGEKKESACEEECESESQTQTPTQVFITADVEENKFVQLPYSLLLLSVAIN